MTPIEEARDERDEGGVWSDWFETLDAQVGGGAEIWVIEDAAAAEIPSFLEGWAESVDSGEDVAAPDASWRRSAALLADEVELVPPASIGTVDRSLYNPHWASQPPTRIWEAWAFTAELAFVWRTKDYERYPVGFTSIVDLDAGMEALADETDDAAGVDYEECVECEGCELPWGENDDENVPRDVQEDASLGTDGPSQLLCGECREAKAFCCDGCSEYFFNANPYDGESNFGDEDMSLCLSCAVEEEDCDR